MSSTTLKIVAVVSVLLAIVLAFVGFQMSRDYAQKAEQAEQARSQASQPEKPQTLAVVALKPLAAYEPIARDAVALVPVTVRPADPYEHIEDVVNKVPLVDIDAGAPVTQRYFREGNVLARIIPPGQQAVSIEVNDVVAVGGFVRPGDIVDILLYLRGGADIEQPQSRVLLKGVRVLAYQERIIDRPEGIKDDDPQTRRSRVRTAVVAVPDADTTKLMLGASIGELRLALHGQVEPGAGDQTGVPTPSAVAASAEAAGKTGAAARPDQAIGIAELSRLKPPPSRHRAPPRARVEILRGDAAREVVTTR